VSFNLQKNTYNYIILFIYIYNIFCLLIMCWFLTAIKPCNLSKYFLAGYSFLLGAQRKVYNNCKSPLVWKISSTVSFPMTYANWYGNNPNCFPHPSKLIENCLNYRSNNDMGFNDIPCEFLACPICQYPGII